MNFWKIRVTTILSFAIGGQLVGCIKWKKDSKTPDENSKIKQVPAAQQVSCSVIVLGGTTAAFAAAITAADNIASGELVCLTEPTDWLGGQLTSSGVPAVDYAHHDVDMPGFGKVKLSDATRDVAANNKIFAQWMTQLGPIKSNKISFPSPPTCWVSVRCFEPAKILSNIDALAKMYESLGRLRVFRNTVVKALKTSNDRITAVTVIEHSKSTSSARLSEQISDWYSPQPSAQSDKNIYQLLGPNRRSSTGEPALPVVIDATEWGEGLVLSGSDFLQGIERNDADPVVQGTQETCGQAIVYPMVLSLSEKPIPDASLAHGKWLSDFRPKIESYKQSLIQRGFIPAGGTPYSISTAKPFTFDDVWTYRRIALGPVKRNEKISNYFPSAQVGDISNQNWELGNDYPYRYLFLPMAEARAQAKRGDWRGGIDAQALAEAELQAWGWFEFLRKNATVDWNGQKKDIGPQIVLSDALGTAHGLSKVPYIRDTRRSIGMNTDGNSFVLKYAEIFTGQRFEDSIGIGAYVADRHPSRNPNVDGQTCSSSSTPPGMTPYPKPFTLPLRAHTHKDIANLLVAGKTIAQTFHTNSATRLHPIEFASGTGAGALASYMLQANVTAHDVVKNTQHISSVQMIAKKYQPIEWTPDVLRAASTAPAANPATQTKPNPATSPMSKPDHLPTDFLPSTIE